MNPIILTFNIRQSVYRQFGLTLFKHIKDNFNIHLLPIVNINEDGIEQRARRLSKKVPQMLQRLKVKNAHFASYSTSGIDFRFALVQHGLDKYANTFTTISTPHKGSKLAWLSDRKFFKGQVIDPISRICGVGLNAFHEFIPENIRNFNNCIKDSSKLQYYSVGSQQLPNLCSYSLSETCKYLTYKTETNFQYYNDGVFGHDQVVWGNHITNFQADHGEVIGMYGSKKSIGALQTVNQIAADWNKRNNENEGKINNEETKKQKVDNQNKSQKVQTAAI